MRPGRVATTISPVYCMIPVSGGKPGPQSGGSKGGIVMKNVSVVIVAVTAVVTGWLAALATPCGSHTHTMVDRKSVV